EIRGRLGQAMSSHQPSAQHQRDGDEEQDPGHGDDQHRSRASLVGPDRTSPGGAPLPDPHEPSITATAVARTRAGPVPRNTPPGPATAPRTVTVTRSSAIDTSMRAPSGATRCPTSIAAAVSSPRA